MRRGGGGRTGRVLKRGCSSFICTLVCFSVVFCILIRLGSRFVRSFWVGGGGWCVKGVSVLRGRELFDVCVLLLRLDFEVVFNSL